ncbi:MerR family transcriptional regulator [Terasakiella sp.]|uniref:MerR family transcriptional regulator n=1 Tax=Terasakiella sp. TaxID=2034861 RepID=UPI003AA7E1CB
MNIQKFAALSGVCAHTLRYYEKIGLLRDVGRNKNGHRDYSENERVWIDFIKRLKETGMALKDIQRYADLRAQGDETAQDRMDLLINHADVLEERLRQENEHLDKLRQKIAFYRKQISGN